MMMNVKENENERMERMLQTLNKRGAENYEKRRQQTIREEIERERIEKEQAAKEQERIRKEIENKKRIRELMAENERIERRREAKKERERQKRIKSIKTIIAVICTLSSATLISYVLDPVGFVEFFKTVGSIIVLIITGAVVKFVSSMPHYTTPHRYIVQDEINKNYKVEKGWHTTTFVSKDRR